MTLDLSATDNLRLHQRLVETAVTDVIGLQEIRGRPAAEVVARYYDSLPANALASLPHRDPLGLAFDLAGEDAPPPSDGDSRFREEFERARDRVVFADPAFWQRDGHD